MPYLKRVFVISNELGLHARAAARFVQIANRFRCEIVVEKDRTRRNGKSLMGVLSLGAAKGEEIEVSCEDEDAEQAMEALAEIIEGGFGER